MKKMFKSLLAMSLVAATTFGLVACGSKSNATDAMSKDKLVLGFDDTFVPMGFKDDSGNVVGFDIDLAKEVSKKIGKEITFQPIDWSMKESELNSGKIDMIWNGYSITDERKEKVSFSKAYLDNRQVIITLADSKISSKADLSGAKVGTQNESSAVDAVGDDQKNFADGKLVTYETYLDALNDLENKRIDAVVADEILIRYYVNQKGADKYKILSDDFGKETYGVGIRKSDTALLSKINEAFDAMKKDGTAKAISIKWFGEDIFK